jgi:NAD(P)H-hydrate epimerase
MGFMKFATSEHIKQLDKLAGENYGIPLWQLMENAGKSIFDAMIEDIVSNKYAVFCGKGNNGGDGFVVARLLRECGYEVKVYLTHSECELSETAKTAFDKLKTTDVKICGISDTVDTDAVIIDALLGVSVNGAPRGNIKSAIDRISTMDNTIVSIDIPSGLSADTGDAAGSVVKADYTYTLALDKVGLNVSTGCILCGQKRVLDIGIPDEAYAESGFCRI